MAYKDANGDDLFILYKTLPIGLKRDSATVFAVCDNQYLISKLGFVMSEKDIQFAVADEDGNLIIKSDGFNADYKNNEKGSKYA